MTLAHAAAFTVTFAALSPLTLRAIQHATVRDTYDFILRGAGLLGVLTLVAFAAGTVVSLVISTDGHTVHLAGMTLVGVAATRLVLHRFVA